MHAAPGALQLARMNDLHATACYMYFEVQSKYCTGSYRCSYMYSQAIQHEQDLMRIDVLTCSDIDVLTIHIFFRLRSVCNTMIFYGVRW